MTQLPSTLQAPDPAKIQKKKKCLIIFFAAQQKRAPLGGGAYFSLNIPYK